MEFEGVIIRKERCEPSVESNPNRGQGVNDTFQRIPYRRYWSSHLACKCHHWSIRMYRGTLVKELEGSLSVVHKNQSCSKYFNGADRTWFDVSVVEE